MHPGLRLLARQGVTARIAVADTAGAAWAAARFGVVDPIQIMPSGMQAEVLADLAKADQQQQQQKKAA